MSQEQKAPPQRRELQWLDVPPTARQKQCAGANCRRTIYMVQSPTAMDKFIPVDCNVAGGRPPFPPDKHDPEGEAGRGVNHFQTCPDWQTFSRQRQP